MRMFSRGKEIPPDDITWEILCRPETLMIEQDRPPYLSDLPHIRAASEKAIRDIPRMLGIVSSEIGRAEKLMRPKKLAPIWPRYLLAYLVPALVIGGILYPTLRWIWNQ